MTDRVQEIKNTINDWKTVLIYFGIPKELLILKGTPCPICGGDDRFAWDGTHHGSGHCRSCGHIDGIHIIQKVNGWNFTVALSEVEKYLGIQHKRKTKYQISKYHKSRHTQRYLKAQQLHCLAIGSKTTLTPEEEARHKEAKRFIQDFKRIYPNHIKEIGI